MGRLLIQIIDGDTGENFSRWLPAATERFDSWANDDLP